MFSRGALFGGFGEAGADGADAGAGGYSGLVYMRVVFDAGCMRRRWWMLSKTHVEESLDREFTPSCSCVTQGREKQSRCRRGRRWNYLFEDVLKTQIMSGVGTLFVMQIVHLERV